MSSVSEQNAQSYDDHAEEWEESLKTNVGHKYMEKPAIESLLPNDLTNNSVLCVGVGSGEEIEEIQERRASKIVGIDISQGLSDRAKQKFPNTTFIQKDMMEIASLFEPETFDLVYSSLAFHYSSDWDVLLAGIYTVLKTGGTLVFSTHHPTYWGTRELDGPVAVNERGITLTRHKAMLGNIPISYYNHPSEASILESLEYAGFKNITHFIPPVIEVSSEQLLLMSDDERSRYERLKEKSGTRALFLVARAQK